MTISCHVDGDGGSGERWDPPDLEEETINEFPVRLSAQTAELVLEVRGGSMRIESWGLFELPREKIRWPTGQRELLIEIAKSIIIADDLNDQDTWYEVNANLPS